MTENNGTIDKAAALLLQGDGGEPQRIDDDMTFDKHDIDSITQHDENYSILLSSFVINTWYNLRSKRRCKKIFFAISIIFMIIILLLLCSIILCAIFGMISGDIVIGVLITGTLSFLTTFITIPTVITHYLFDPKEDESMTVIISKLQEYDQNIRNCRK